MDMCRIEIRDFSILHPSWPRHQLGPPEFHISIWSSALFSIRPWRSIVCERSGFFHDHNDFHKHFLSVFVPQKRVATWSEEKADSILFIDLFPICVIKCVQIDIHCCCCELASVSGPELVEAVPFILEEAATAPHYQSPGVLMKKPVLELIFTKQSVLWAAQSCMASLSF